MTTSSHKGFSLPELLIALTIGGLIVAIGLPSLSNALRRSRLNAAVRQITSDVRKARSQAITTGWEYRVVGFDAGSSTRRNQYRFLARRATSVAWPADTVAPFRSDTQFAGAWSDIGSSFHGVSLDADDPRFEVTFDARGAAPAVDANFNPLRVSGTAGTTTLTISAAGGITIE